MNLFRYLRDKIHDDSGRVEAAWESKEKVLNEDFVGDKRTESIIESAIDEFNTEYGLADGGAENYKNRLSNTDDRTEMVKIGEEAFEETSENASGSKAGRLATYGAILAIAVFGGKEIYDQVSQASYSNNQVTKKEKEAPKWAQNQQTTYVLDENRVDKIKDGLEGKARSEMEYWAGELEEGDVNSLRITALPDTSYIIKGIGEDNRVTMSRRTKEGFVGEILWELENE